MTGSRVLSNIEKYAKYGANDNGGVTRPSFSEADLEIRKLFIQDLKELGLSIVIDGAGNIWGNLKGSGLKRGSIVIGSHLDSVPNGGKYDGPLGVLMAIEIIQTLKENHILLDHDIEIVSFTAEESNDFNLPTFGSRSFAGKLTVDRLQHVQDSRGFLLSDALKKVGGGLEKYSFMTELRQDKKAFLELHIEQGKRLESHHLPVAIVDHIVGTYRSHIKVTGEANHSGTTMMDLRKDALTAASEMILAVERYCQNPNHGVVGTVGRLNVIPNAANIIPGQVDFVLELRGETEENIQNALSFLQEKWNDIAYRRKIDIQQAPFLNQKPVNLDTDIRKTLQDAAEQLKIPYMNLSSMAVHDAAHMATITKSAMLFVRSIDGKSHCPEEYSTPEDIEAARKIILEAVIKLDSLLE